MDNDEFSYGVGVCDVCGQGMVLIARDKINNNIFVICNECESQWASPQDFQKGGNSLSSSEHHHDVVDATLDEIKKRGWDGFIEDKIPRDFA